MSQRAVALSLVLFGITASARASAQSDPANVQLAQALYDDAVKDLHAKHEPGASFAVACGKLEEAIRLVPEGIGAKLTLAECYEADGRLASAWSAYGIAEAAAARANQADRRDLAHSRGEALKPKLAKITIVVGDAVKALPGLEITRDGVSVGRPLWGVALPADRGKHVIALATSDGRRSEREVLLRDDGVSEIVALDEAPAARAGAQRMPDSPLRASEERSGLRTAGYVLTGVGAVALLGGAAAGIAAIIKKSASNGDQHCTGNLCDQTGYDLRNASLAAGNASTGLFVAGAVILAAGVTVIVLSPPRSTTSGSGARQGPSVALSFGAGTTSLRGAF